MIPTILFNVIVGVMHFFLRVEGVFVNSMNFCDFIVLWDWVAREEDAQLC